MKAVALVVLRGATFYAVFLAFYWIVYSLFGVVGIAAALGVQIAEAKR